MIVYFGIKVYEQNLIDALTVLKEQRIEAEDTCLSDFCGGISRMSDTMSVALDRSSLDGEYTIRIYTIDSYGFVSENFAEGTIQEKRGV